MRKEEKEEEHEEEEEEEEGKKRRETCVRVALDCSEVLLVSSMQGGRVGGK